MRVVTKILLTILIFCAGSTIITLIVNALGNKVSSGGIGPIIIIPAMLAGIRAVWKYNPEKEEEDENDNYQLNKE